MRLRSTAILCALLVLPAACDSSDGGAVGAPCNTADDCQGALICDEHDGQASCQEPHDHGETDAGSESSTTDVPTGTTGADESDTTPDQTSSTSTGAAETTGTETGAAETTGTGGEDSTGGDELCVAFCGCMQTACSGYEAYPYADEPACLAACEALDEPTLQCYGGFCQQAADADGSLAEHFCEHAWGDLGDDKC